MKRKIIVLALIILIIILIFVSFSKTSSQEPADSNLDTFAKCLKDSGALFYGAYWCSHCENQKEAFGLAAKYLPYIECANPDGRSQNIKCKNAGITGYPTWVFGDDSRLSGEVDFKTLAEKSGCVYTP